MKLSEVAKSARKKDDSLRRNAGAAVSTAGGVAALTGYATGGVPGKTVTDGSALRRGLQGGIMGSREISHREFADELRGRISSPAKASRLGDFRSSRVAGKLPPEDKIVRHLRIGRRAGNVAMVGGLAAVGGGLHLRRQKKKKVVKADKDRRKSSAPGAMVGGGLTAAGIGHVVPMELFRQGRKWEATEARNTKQARRLVPGLVDRKHPIGDYDKVNVQELGTRAGKRVRRRPPTRAAVREAGRLHGEATQAKYFANVYRKHGNIVRAVRGPGLAVAGAGAVGLAVQQTRNRKREMPNSFAKQDGVYPYLNANIREDAEGIPAVRKNPISPMQMLAASNIMAGGYMDVSSKWPFGRRKRVKRGMYQLGIGAQMGVQPVGYGVML